MVRREQRRATLESKINKGSGERCQEAGPRGAPRMGATAGNWGGGTRASPARSHEAGLGRGGMIFPDPRRDHAKPLVSPESSKIPIRIVLPAHLPPSGVRAQRGVGQGVGVPPSQLHISKVVICMQIKTPWKPGTSESF